MYLFFCRTADSRAIWKLLDYAYCLIFKSRMPEVRKTSTGKPYFDDDRQTYFSVSHTKDGVLVLLGSYECGCDIEKIKPVDKRIINRVASVKERKQFTSLELWTLKEAAAKLVDDDGAYCDVYDFMLGTVFSKDGNHIYSPNLPNMMFDAFLVEDFQIAYAVSAYKEQPAFFEISELELLNRYA